MTILESLLSQHSYPLDGQAVRLLAQRRGLSPDDGACGEVLSSDAWQLARADVLMMVASAPNVTQEGVSYDVLYSTREALRNEAEKVYRKYLDPSDPLYPKAKRRYGYKGSLLKR